MKKVTTQEARKRILRYCAYQERSHHEVKEKLYGFGLTRAEVDELMVFLIEEGFLNEERFAKAFAGGKFRIKKWGRLKIARELERHRLTANCIRIGLKELDEASYQKTLQQMLIRKAKEMSEPNLFIRRNKLSKYVIQKGYEPDLAWSEIKRLWPD
jgi:regulatory protein